MVNDTSETIGCDLGDKTSEICVLTAAGSMERATARTTATGLEAFFTRPSAHVVIEVGPHSRWVSELLERLGHRVTIANARQVKLISSSTLGDGRGVPADRLRPIEFRIGGGLTDSTTPTSIYAQKVTSTGGRKTTNRPVRATAHDPVLYRKSIG